MGFAICYSTTESIEPERVNAIKAAADALNNGRTWLSCEPLGFDDELDEGRLSGSSKPNLGPHPDDVAAVAAEDLPDGTVHDLLNALREISRKHNVDWEFSHDHDPSPVGFIRRGLADEQLLERIGALGELANALVEMLDDDEFDLDENGSDHESARLPEEDRDDDAPPTIRLWAD